MKPATSGPDGDMELLALAAKAAGWPPALRREGHTLVRRNPLTDDGDALRLAVKLGMFVDVFPESHVHAQAGGATERIDEQWGSDPYAATRRAIVRAAAEIGKAMP